MSAFISAFDQLKPSEFSVHKVSALKPFEFIFGEMKIDVNSEFYPQRSDLKIMRSDVAASILLTNLLIQNLSLKINREDAGLFVASGVFIENSDTHLNHLIQVFEDYEKTTDPAEKMRKLFRASPPLLALQTLTNSSMSFIAQYTGIKGNNATFGTTSLSGACALHHAFQEAIFNHTNSFVCATNCAGPQSFLMNLPFTTYSPEWKESSSVATLLVSPENDEQKAFCKIREINFFGMEPSLRTESTRLPKDLLNKLADSETVFFSGGYTPAQNEKIHSLFGDHKFELNSSFDEFGNMGPVNLLSGIGQAISMFSEETKTVADIIDVDVYGRIAHVKLESC